MPQIKLQSVLLRLWPRGSARSNISMRQQQEQFRLPGLIRRATAATAAAAMGPTTSGIRTIALPTP